MKKYLINSGLLMMILVAGVIYGIVIHRYEVFPYGIIKMANHHLIHKEQKYGPWSIGEGRGSNLEYGMRFTNK